MTSSNSTAISDDTGADDATIVALRKNPEYLKWFVSDVAADAGAAINSFAAPLIALAVTGSLSISGGIAAATALAATVCMLPGGVLADRYDRKQLLLIGHGYGTVLWLTGIVLFFSNLLSTAVLAALGVLAGVRAGIFGSVSTPALRRLVQSSQLPQALAANEARDGALRLISGPIGGSLVALTLWAPYAVQAIGHALAWGCVRAIKTDLKPTLDGKPDGSPLGQLGQGYDWLMERRTITVVLVIAAVLSLAAAGSLQTVVLHLVVSSENQARIGLVSTALAIGMILGSVLAGTIVKRFPTGVLCTIAIGCACSVLALLVAVRSFAGILIVVAGAAIALPVFNSAASGWAISQIPDDQVGAISSAAGLLNSMFIPFTPLIAGVGLDTMGYGFTITVFVAAMLCGALTLALTSDFRSLPRPDQWQHHANS